MCMQGQCIESVVENITPQCAVIDTISPPSLCIVMVCS